MTNGRSPGTKGDRTGSAKSSTRHPYGAFEHRVADSPAYADLTFSARAMLVLIIRQLTKDNNGHLMGTFSFMRRYGFESEHTISRAIKELIAHGMIYRTRSGGYQQGAAQYAVTWLSIKNREGLFLDGFKPCAWRDWEPDEKKSPPSNLQRNNCKKGTRTATATAQSAVDILPKNADTVFIPVVTNLSADAAAPPCEFAIEVDSASNGGKAARVRTEKSARLPDAAKLMLCQHSDCDVPVVGREFCAKHRPLETGQIATEQSSLARSSQ